MHAAAKSVHPPHREGQNCVEAYLDCVHIDIAGLVPVKPAHGKEYMFVVVDEMTIPSSMQAVHMCPLQHKSDALQAFRIFKQGRCGE